MIPGEVSDPEPGKEAQTEKKNAIKDDSDRKVGKLSHKKWRQLWKKEKRRKMRQQKRLELDRIEEEQRIKSGLTTEEAVEAQRKQEEWQELLLEKKRQRLHDQWVEAEKVAQEEFQRKKLEEERRRNERLEQERRIKDEWERQQKQEEKQRQRRDQAVKEREENLNQELKKSGIIKASDQDGDDDDAWHNPIATTNVGNTGLYGTEKDPNNCAFYLKTGACRFGERCSRQHPRPSSSQTLLIPNMFQDVRLTEVMLDEKDQDVELEFDEDELYSNFKNFYKDVLEEFKSVGQVYQFKVCCNFEPHLRGNVYIQYRSEEEAMSAFAKFNGRWYGGKQLSVQFSPVTKWKSAICGTFARKKCPRGKNCNFLHVFKNPNNEFRDADRDFDGRRSPRQGNIRQSEREWWSSTRELERRWDRAESEFSERSRNSRGYGDTRYRSYRRHHDKSRSRGRSRSRDRSYPRDRSRSAEKERYSSRDSGKSRTRSGRLSQKRRSSRSPDRRSTYHRRSRSSSPNRNKKQNMSRRRRSSSDSSSSDDYYEPKRGHDRKRHIGQKDTVRYSSEDEFVPEFDSDE